MCVGEESGAATLWYSKAMLKRVVSFFDKLEDKVRIRLSHSPILYSLIGAVGIILLWKGVWEIAEAVPALHGIGSVAAGVIILLASGLLVSFFIGDSIILSGFKREKKLTERTEEEILTTEKAQAAEILSKLDHMQDGLDTLVAKQDKPTP